MGRLGAAQLGAVGLSSIIFNFCGMIFNFLVVVTTPTVAAAVAQGDFERVSTQCTSLLSLFLKQFMLHALRRFWQLAARMQR